MWVAIWGLLLAYGLYLFTELNGWGGYLMEFLNNEPPWGEIAAAVVPWYWPAWSSGPSTA